MRLEGRQRAQVPRYQVQTTHAPIGADTHTVQGQFLPHSQRRRLGRGLHRRMKREVLGRCSLEEVLFGTAQTRNTG